MIVLRVPASVFKKMAEFQIYRLSNHDGFEGISTCCQNQRSFNFIVVKLHTMIVSSPTENFSPPKVRPRYRRGLEEANVVMQTSSC